MEIKFQSYGRKKNVDITVNEFKGATNTLIDDARLNPSQAKESVNLIQVQDGLWKVRPGTINYGQALGGESSIDGAIEYIKDDGTRETIAIGGTTGTVYKSIDGGSWTAISGATLTAGNTPYFLQIKSNLYITNGVNNLTRYNGITLSQYTALSAPSGINLNRTTLTAGSFNLYYQVTALNDVGETEGSTEATITVNKVRNAWAGGEKITISWSSVTGATRYQVYYSDQTGYEVLLGSTTSTSFDDDGTIQENPYIEVPDANTTAAPKFRQMELSGSRIWATQDPVNPWRVYFSGTGVNQGIFSDFYGGGYIDLEQGGRDRPVAVVHFRTGKGDSVATVLCSSPEGRGSIWQISLESITVGETTFTVPSAIKIVGSVGANAPYGVVKAGDNIFFSNKKGIFALRNKAQLFNVLSTDELSSPIRPSYRAFAGNYIDTISGYYHEGKVYYSIPRSTRNDSIMIYDIERNNWNYYWTIGAKQFMEYTDSSGTSYLLGVPVTGNQLFQFTESVATDLGVKFNTSYISGLLPISRDKTEFGRNTETFFEFGRPRGVIKCEVSGIDYKEGFKLLGSKTINVEDTSSTVDFTSGLFGEYSFSDDDEIPTTFTQATIKKRIKVPKPINAIQYHVYSDQADTDYTILSIQTKGTITPTRPPTRWTN